ncbi:MAG: sulfite exporter TauE/SafE family protein [Hyphomicrobiaceae bacterium]|nr:sulfite exporter TauE/SafE family protein [Hyphomicrobiaceae bacterium]
MITDPWFFAVALPAIVLTGLSKGGFLGGIGGLAVPLMSLVISPVQAAGIMLPILIAMDWIGVWAYRRDWSGPNLKIMLPAATVGILVGWAAAAYVTEAQVRLLVGLIGAVFTLDHWLGLRPRGLAPGPKVGKGSLWGALAGFTSFVSHTGGPPFAVYMLPQRLPNAVYAGTAVMFFTVVNIIKVPPYLFLGQFNAENLKTVAVLMPIAPLAILAGVWLTRRVPQEPFYNIAYACLFVISVKLVWDGLRALALGI